MPGSHTSPAGPIVEEKGFALSPLVNALDSNTLALALSYLGREDDITLAEDDSRQYVSSQESWEAKIELYYPGEEKELKVAECKDRLNEDFSKLSPEHAELFRAVIEEDREFLLKLKAPLKISSREVTELKGPQNKTLLQRTKNIRDPEIKKYVLGCIFVPNNLNLSWAIRCQQPLTEIQKLIARGGFNFEDAILAAIEEENNEVLKKILESADRDYRVNFALMLAVKRGRVKAVRFLLEQDFEHFPLDLNQPTPLWTAIGEGDSATMVLLLEKEEKQWNTLSDEKKEYGLELIASSGNLPLLQRTLPADYKNFSTLYRCAAKSGHPEVADFLITWKMKQVDIQTLPTGMIHELLKVKYAGIKRGLITPEQAQQRSQIIAQLIKEGYPLPVRNSDINDAAKKGESEIVLAMLKRDSKLIGGLHDYDNGLLLDAIANGHVVLAQKLLQFIEELLNDEEKCAVLTDELKQKIFSKGNSYDGKTVCEIAAEKGYPLIDRIIILYMQIYGPLTETALGPRVLHYAAYNGHLAMVQKLLKEFPNNPSFLNANRNPDERCKLSAGTPLGLAVENEQWTVVAFLLEQENIDAAEAYAAWPKLYKGAKNLAFEVLKIKPQLTPQAFTEEDYALIADLLKEKLINKEKVNLHEELKRAIEALNEEAALIFIAEGAASLDKLIHLAIKLGLTQVVAAILQKEPALVTSIEGHNTLLLVAARHGHIDVVNLLVGFPELARNIDTALVLAIGYAYWNVAECLLTNPAINQEISWESFVTVFNHDVESALQICRANPGFLTKATEKNLDVVERLLDKPELNDIAEAQTAFEVLLSRASENARVLRICRANPGFLTIAPEENLDRVERLLVIPGLNDIAEAQTAFKALLSREGENERVLRICRANPGFLTIVTQENPDRVENFLVKPELNNTVQAQEAFKVLLSRAGENESKRVLRIAEANPALLDKITLRDYPETIEYFLDHSNSLAVLAKIPEREFPIRLDQREKIRGVLFAKVDAAGGNKAAAINLLEGWRNNSLFAKHRKPCWRGGFARTNSQCLIDEKLKGLRQ